MPMSLNLALASLLVKLHPLALDREPIYPYSATFTAAILHVVSREVFEISDRPATFSTLTQETDELLKRECRTLKAKNRRLRVKGLAVPQIQEDAEVYESWMGQFALEFQDPASGCSYLDHLEHEITDRISEKADEDLADTQEPFERKSPLALFLRSVVTSLKKLSFEDTAKVSREVAQWCGIAVPARNSRKVLLLNGVTAEDHRSSAIKEYQNAVASGDYSLALSSLRRFYDHDAPGSINSQHAHAVLHLATFLFQSGGIHSARTAVDEAIRIARKDGDKICLQHCMSLSHQLCDKPGPSTAGARRATLSHLPKPATANDELIMLLTALDLGEPLPQAMQRIHLALARSEVEIDAWHVLQARMWDEMAVSDLAIVHEDLALEEGSSQRITVEVSRATRAASTGNFHRALSALMSCNPETMSEYSLWSEAIWEILQRQAELRDDDKAISLISSLRSIPTTSSSASATIRAKIRKSIKLLDSAPAHVVLPHILEAIDSAQKFGAWRVHRLATVVMADVLLKLDKGLGEKVIGLLSEIVTEDEDVMAMAALILGKAEVEVWMKTEDSIRMTLASANKLGYRKVGIDASTILALLEVDEPYQEPSPLSAQIQQIAEVVKLVGTKVANHA